MKKSTRVCFGLRNPTSSPHHCSGINSIAYDEKRGILFTASRDATVRQWLVPPGEHPESVRCHQVHSDWVNDIALIPNDSKFVTAGSDCGVCVVSYDAENVYDCEERLYIHKDYVKKVLWRSGKVISAGLDGQVAIQSCDASKGWIIDWHCQKKHSVYALDANAFGTLIACGGADQVIRIFDTRAPAREGKKKPAFKLDEHKDTVKSLCMLEDVTLLSGGADNSILHWDFRKLVTPIRSFELHEDSVWHISPASQSSVYTGSRDGDAYRVEYKTGRAERLVHDSEPISSIVRLPSSDGRLVTASAMGTVKFWNVDSPSDASIIRWQAPRAERSTDETSQSSQLQLPTQLRREGEALPTPVTETPSFVLKRGPSIVKTQILPNRLQILTLDSNGTVELLDIFKGKVSKSFGNVDFDKTLQEVSEQVSVPSWCSADCKLGSITITLDGASCLDAFILAEDAGLVGSEKPICVGAEMINFLFDEFWAKARPEPNGEDEAAESQKPILVDLPQDIWVALTSEGVCMFVKDVDDWKGDERLPGWIVEVLKGNTPAAKKMTLRIKASSGLRALSRADVKESNQLTSTAFSKLAKYVTYYAEAVLKFRMLPLIHSEEPPELRLKHEDEVASMFTIRCKDKEVSHRISLATLKNCIWKSSGDPLIEIDVKPEFAQRLKP